MIGHSEETGVTGCVPWGLEGRAAVGGLALTSSILLRWVQAQDAVVAVAVQGEVHKLCVSELKLHRQLETNGDGCENKA